MFSTWLLSVLNPDSLLLPEQTERKGTEAIISFSVSEKSLEISLSIRETHSKITLCILFQFQKLKLILFLQKALKHTHTQTSSVRVSSHQAKMIYNAKIISCPI